MVLMYIVVAATLACVYLLAHHFYGERQAFQCGFQYVTAVAAAFFIPLTYDIVAVFLLVFSFLLFVKRDIVSAYLMATAGALMKWFPLLGLPLYFLHSIKTKQTLLQSRNGILISLGTILLFTLPFAYLNLNGFLFTYTFHMNRIIQTHSFVFYCDTISQFFFQAGYFSPISFLLLVIVEIGLLGWYYHYLDENLKTVGYTLFLSVFFFIIFNKVFSASYIIWITPFLALFLAHSVRHIILFYLTQLIIYIETPLLYRIVYGDGKPYFIFDQNFLSFLFAFYSIKFLIFATVLWAILRDIKKHSL